MAHEFETGFFVNQPAWHGLGTLLSDPPTIVEALADAGLNWRVELAPLLVGADVSGPVLDGHTRPAALADEPIRAVGHRAVVRSHDRSILGVVGPDYEPLQNTDALAWFQPFVDSGAVRLEAAGSLRGGKRVWVLGRVIGSSADVVKRDRVDQFVLLANGHDGTLSIRCGFTAVRVVCQNTLTASLNDKGSKLLRIRHTRGAVEALHAAQDVINVARGEFAATAEQFRYLASRGCDTDTLRAYVREVFELSQQETDVDTLSRLGLGAKPEKDDETLGRLGLGSRIVKRIEGLAESGRGAETEGVRGTMWGAYNAVTEYLTHERGQDQGSRVDNAWFGQSAQLGARALRVGLKVATAGTKAA